MPYWDAVELHSRVYALLFHQCEGVSTLRGLMSTILIAARTGDVPEVVIGSLVEDHLFTPGDMYEFMDKMEAVLTQSRDYLIGC